MVKYTLALLVMATPALAADPVLSFVFKSEKLELGADGLADASPSFDAQGAEPVVLFWLSQTGASGFAKITARHVGEQMNIMVCGKVIASPIIREAIQGSRWSFASPPRGENYGDSALNSHAPTAAPITRR
jgi:preprotein translocase subunit SecD